VNLAEPEECIVRVAGDPRQVSEWALVLASAGISGRALPEGGDWVLIVRSDDAARARRALDAFERENRPVTKPQRDIEYGRSYGGLFMAALLVGFYLVTGPGTAGGRWVRAGDAVAARILDGEPWRIVTALTLHADPLHLLSNVAFGALLATAVCWWLGPGLGAWLILLSGAVGNWLTAWVRGDLQASLGASTAVLGAAGILGGLQAARWYRYRHLRRRSWVAVAAAVGLLAMLGSAAGTDVVAHLFGFLAGVALGAIAGLLLERLPSRRVQAVMAVAALLAVLGCWAMALGYGR
jgi:membrane associated rhomboid family serine protease